MSETSFEGPGSPGFSEDDPIHIGLFPRAIIEFMPDIPCTGSEDHSDCLGYKGASWPNPLPGMDLNEEEPPWLEGGESDDLP